MGGDQWLLPENVTLFFQARRVHLSGLGKGLSIVTRTDKGVGVVSSRTVGTDEGSRTGVSGDLDSTYSPCQLGVIGEALGTCFIRKKFSEGSGRSPPPPIPTFLLC